VNPLRGGAAGVPEPADQAAAGGEVLPGAVERFASLLAAERERYDRLIREARIKPD
jgi:hypothetical protein